MKKELYQIEKSLRHYAAVLIQQGSFSSLHISYFFSYKIEFFPSKRVFSFQNNPKNLDPSYKMDLDLWELFRKGKT